MSCNATSLELTGIGLGVNPSHKPLLCSSNSSQENCLNKHASKHKIVVNIYFLKHHKYLHFFKYKIKFTQHNSVTHISFDLSRPLDT